MTRSARALALRPLVIILAAVTLVGPIARADDFSLFRIPKHRVSGWDGTLNGWGSRNVFNNPYEQRESRDFRGDAGTALFWHSEDDARFTSASLSFAARGQSSVTELLSQTTFVPGQLSVGQSEQSDRAGDEFWVADVGLRRYPFAAPIGVSIRASGRGRYGQAWTTTDQDVRNTSSGLPEERTITQTTTNQYRQAHDATGDLGLGLGKVRDATGIYEALVIEQRLRQRGVIEGRLRPSTRQRIAELLYVRYDVLSTVQRPARRMWEELDRVLREDGAVDVDRLDAESIQRAGEALFEAGPSSDVLPSSPLLRRRGAFVGGRIQGAHFRELAWGETSNYTRTTLDDSVTSESRTTNDFSAGIEDDALWAGPTAEWHAPFGPRVQLDVEGAVLFALTGEDGRWNENSIARLGWIVADRWLASVDARHSRWVGSQSIGFGALVSEGWTVSYGGSLRYFIEDRLSLELAAAEVQQRVDASFSLPLDPPPSYQRSAQVRLGLRVHIMGQFDAPGLTRPIRI